MKKLTIILLFLLSLSIYADDETDFFSDDVSFEDFDMDELFGDEGSEDFIEVVEDKSSMEAAIPETVLLTTQGVEFGGSFSSSISAGLVYATLPEKFEDITDSKKYKETFSPSLSASLHFNARPDANSRYFGKVTTSLPFYDGAKALVENPAKKGDTSEADFADVKIPKIKVYELFADFNYNNKLFFRVGKQNAKWGVGYFFSPADFLSLETIDPQNPTADREGPIAIKVNMPFGLNNLYTYFTVPNSMFSKVDPSVTDLIIAPMFQMLLGETEVSTGIYYQKDSAPRGMISATYGTNTSIGQFSFFGEAVGLYGSDKIFIKDDYTTEKFSEKLFFNGTVGFMWSKKILENNFSLAVQYLYNGEGYDNDSKLVSNVLKALKGDVSGIPLQYMANIEPLRSSGLGYTDLSNRNQHYLGVNWGISNMFNIDKLSVSTFAMMNLADISGFVQPSISYRFFDGLSTALSCNVNIGEEGDEYFGNKLSVSLKFNMGLGNF